jgi:hypothetical protein
MGVVTKDILLAYNSHIYASLYMYSRMFNYFSLSFFLFFVGLWLDLRAYTLSHSTNRFFSRVKGFLR